MVNFFQIFAIEIIFFCLVVVICDQVHNLLSLQQVLCRVAALKSSPVYHPLCRLYFKFGPLRSAEIF